MKRIVLTYDEGGMITDWRYEPDGYTPTKRELSVHRAFLDPVEIPTLRVDVESSPPELVDLGTGSVNRTVSSIGVEVSSLVERGPVQRAKVTEDTKQAFRDARSNDDLQAQLDVVFEILTGEEP